MRAFAHFAAGPARRVKCAFCGGGSVTVQCADVPRPATLTVEWEFDPDVHRRAHQRHWHLPMIFPIVD